MSQYGYQHSETFAILKGHKETITDNLTSYQYLSVLDDLIYNALYPLIEGTRFVDVFLGQILSWQTSNPKRKVCGIGRKEFSAYLTTFFLLDDPAAKLKVLKRLKLDRAVLFETLRRWLTIADGVKQVGYEPFTLGLVTQLYELHEKAGVKPSYGLFAVYSQVNYWHHEANVFKTQILEKYYRLVLNTAKRDYEALNHTVPLGDMIQHYLMTASKAIDKCDSDRGVLTTHIQNWLMSAKSVVQSTQSQNLPFKKGGKSVMPIESVSLDDLDEMTFEPDEQQDTQDTIQHVREIAKLFDPIGYGRICLGIQEVLTTEDKQALRALAVTESVNDVYDQQSN